VDNFSEFRSGDVRIAYIDEGAGEPVLLIHGFGSNVGVNWRSTGWIDALTRAGRRVIAFDNRGHGRSGKVYEPALYHPAVMAGDARNLLDHLGIEAADVLGYSMGARIAAFLALDQPMRVRSLVLGGLGMALVDGMRNEDEIITALEAPDLSAVQGDTGRLYRSFADRTGADRRALVACLRGTRVALTPEQLGEMRVPVMVAVGELDKIAGSAVGLARLIPGAQLLHIPGRDHLPATGDRTFKLGVIDFFNDRR